MSEGGQRGTGDDYVLSFFFFFSFLSSFIVPHGEVRGGREERSFRLLEELVRTALTSSPG